MQKTSKLFLTSTILMIIATDNTVNSKSDNKSSNVSYYQLVAQRDLQASLNYLTFISKILLLCAIAVSVYLFTSLIIAPSFQSLWLSYGDQLESQTIWYGFYLTVDFMISIFGMMSWYFVSNLLVSNLIFFFTCTRLNFNLLIWMRWLASSIFSTIALGLIFIILLPDYNSFVIGGIFANLIEVLINNPWITMGVGLILLALTIYFATISPLLIWLNSLWNSSFSPFAKERRKADRDNNEQILSKLKEISEEQKRRELNSKKKYLEHQIVNSSWAKLQTKMNSKAKASAKPKIYLTNHKQPWFQSYNLFKKLSTIHKEEGKAGDELQLYIEPTRAAKKRYYLFYNLQSVFRDQLRKNINFMNLPNSEQIKVNLVQIKNRISQLESHSAKTGFAYVLYTLGEWIKDPLHRNSNIIKRLRNEYIVTKDQLYTSQALEMNFLDIDHLTIYDQNPLYKVDSPVKTDDSVPNPKLNHEQLKTTVLPIINPIDSQDSSLVSSRMSFIEQVDSVDDTVSASPSVHKQEEQSIMPSMDDQLQAPIALGATDSVINNSSNKVNYFKYAYIALNSFFNPKVATVIKQLPFTASFQNYSNSKSLQQKLAPQQTHASNLTSGNPFSLEVQTDNTLISSLANNSNINLTSNPQVVLPSNTNLNIDAPIYINMSSIEEIVDPTIINSQSYSQQDYDHHFVEFNNDTYNDQLQEPVINNVETQDYVETVMESPKLVPPIIESMNQTFKANSNFAANPTTVKINHQTDVASTITTYEPKAKLRINENSISSISHVEVENAFADAASLLEASSLLAVEGRKISVTKPIFENITNAIEFFVSVPAMQVFNIHRSDHDHLNIINGWIVKNNLPITINNMVVDRTLVKYNLIAHGNFNFTDLNQAIRIQNDGSVPNKFYIYTRNEEISLIVNRDQYVINTSDLLSQYFVTTGNEYSNSLKYMLGNNIIKSEFNPSVGTIPVLNWLNIQGNNIYITGQAGSGISFTLNNLIFTTAFLNHYDAVKMAIFTQNRYSNLNKFKDLPHLLAPVTDEAAEFIKLIDFVYCEYNTRKINSQLTGKSYLELNDFILNSGSSSISTILSNEALVPNEFKIEFAPLIVIYIDQLSRYISELRKESLLSLFENLVLNASEYGIQFVVGDNNLYNTPHFNSFNTLITRKNTAENLARIFQNNKLSESINADSWIRIFKKDGISVLPNSIPAIHEAEKDALVENLLNRNPTRFEAFMSYKPTTKLNQITELVIERSPNKIKIAKDTKFGFKSKIFLETLKETGIIYPNFENSSKEQLIDLSSYLNLLPQLNSQNNFKNDNV